MVKDHSDSERGNPLPPHGLLYSFWLTARVLLCAPSHRQDSTYHGLCYTSRGALTGTRNSSMGPAHEGSIQRPIAPWANVLTTELYLALLPRSYISLSYHGAISRSLTTELYLALLPRSYISLSYHGAISRSFHLENTQKYNTETNLPTCNC